MRVVLITGGAGGIGRALATAFAKEGCAVVLHYHTSQQQAQQLAQQLCNLGCEVWPVQADVTSRPQVEAMVAAAEARYGHIDVLVNNAGIAQQKLFGDLSPKEWNRMLDTHVGGAFHCCQCVLPGMIRRQSGSIVNISSIWGMVGASCEVHYSTAKAALIGFTKALAKELGPSHITVNCVAPGVIDTAMNQNLGEETLHQLAEDTPLQTLGLPEDVAEAVLFLASQKASFITGQVLSPNGGFVI